jgi:hypothetical protein
LRSSTNIIRLIKKVWIGRTGYVAHMRKVRNVYNIFVGKTKRKRTIVIPRRRREDYIKLYFK